MRKLMVAALVAGAAMGSPVWAQDAEIDPERRALLVSIIEGLGCKVNGAAPPQQFLDAMEEHDFVRDETKAIAAQLMEEGVASRQGPDLILKTENCS